MSKKSKDPNMGEKGVNPSYGYAYVIGEGIQDRLVGNILGILELAGLTEKQEESAKNLMRRAVWDCFTEAIYIKPERHNAIRETYYEERNKTGRDYPMNAI